MREFRARNVTRRTVLYSLHGKRKKRPASVTEAGLFSVLKGRQNQLRFSCSTLAVMLAILSISAWAEPFVRSSKAMN